MGLNPTEGTDIHLLFVVCHAASGLCNKLITHSEKPYWVCVIYKPQQTGGLDLSWAVVPQKKSMLFVQSTALY
jgi:hypothetical protein